LRFSFDFDFSLWIVPLASPHTPVSAPIIVATLPKWCEAYHWA
jgi:hypothetical protein